MLKRSYLPSDCTIRFIRRGRLEDPLLLLRRQRRVQRDDFDIADFGPQVVDLPLDSLAGLVDFLQDGARVNPGVACVCETAKSKNRF